MPHLSLWRTGIGGLAAEDARDAHLRGILHCRVCLGFGRVETQWIHGGAGRAAEASNEEEAAVAAAAGAEVRPLCAVSLCTRKNFVMWNGLPFLAKMQHDMRLSNQAWYE